MQTRGPLSMTIDTIICEAIGGGYARARRAFERVGANDRAGDLLGTVDPVRVPRDGPCLSLTSKREGKRKEKLDITVPAPFAANRDCCLSAGQQDTRRRRRLTIEANLFGDARH